MAITVATASQRLAALIHPRHCLAAPRTGGRSNMPLPPKASPAANWDCSRARCAGLPDRRLAETIGRPRKGRSPACWVPKPGRPSHADRTASTRLREGQQQSLRADLHRVYTIPRRPRRPLPAPGPGSRLPARTLNTRPDRAGRRRRRAMMKVSAIAVVVGLNVILGATRSWRDNRSTSTPSRSRSMAKSARAPIRSTSARKGCG